MKLLLTMMLTIGLKVLLVSSHGRLMNPPSRASMWRAGFDTPKDWNDNQGNCGGAWYQNGENGGKCGICGDGWGMVREHEAPDGKFATGTIVATYSPGETVPVQVDITANHKGYFTFKLCANNNPAQDPLQDCFDKTTVLQPSGEDKWYIPTDDLSKDWDFVLDLVLPEITCTQCILQWTYTTGNSWGCDDVTGECGIGFGLQETFRACSDIAIA